MSIDIQAATYASSAEMQAAHRARQQRFAAAARRVPQDPEIVPRKPCEVIEFVPAPPRIVQQDAHVRTWQLWRFEQVALCQTYIRRRCEELGVDHDELMSPSRSRTIVPIRDKLAYEIKTFVKPDITWHELGRHFGREHTAILTAFNRGAAAAGNQERIAWIERRKAFANERYERARAHD